MPESGGDPATPEEVYCGRVAPKLPRWRGWAKAFRETLSAAGDKSDVIDRSVLARLLATLHTQFKPWRPDALEIVALRLA